MLPLSDENPTRLTPFINWSIIAICVLAFIFQTSAGPSHFIYTLNVYGIVPERIISGSGYYTFITNIFLHGGWSHLLGNMLFLWIFGDNIEDCIVSRSDSKILGRFSYMIFYLVCGVSASLIWMITAWNSPFPAVGASGAIAGVLGAYFTFFPRAQVRTLIGFGYFFRIIRIRAYTLIGLWALYQFLLAIVPINTGVAFWAHVGGFIVGLILAKIIGPDPRRVQFYSP